MVGLCHYCILLTNGQVRRRLARNQIPSDDQEAVSVQLCFESIMSTLRYLPSHLPLTNRHYLECLLQGIVSQRFLSDITTSFEIAAVWVWRQGYPNAVRTRGKMRSVELGRRNRNSATERIDFKQNSIMRPPPHYLQYRTCTTLYAPRPAARVAISCFFP